MQRQRIPPPIGFAMVVLFVVCILYLEWEVQNRPWPNNNSPTGGGGGCCIYVHEDQ